MLNKYRRKIDRGTASIEILRPRRSKSLKDAAASFNLSYMFLSRYIKKKDAYEANPKSNEQRVQSLEFIHSSGTSYSRPSPPGDTVNDWAHV